MANVWLWLSHFASVNAAKSGPQHKAWINWWEACSGGQGEEVPRKHRSGLNKCLRPVTPTQPHSPTTLFWEELRKKETILSPFCRQISLSKWRRSTQGLINIVWKSTTWKMDGRNRAVRQSRAGRGRFSIRCWGSSTALPDWGGEISPCFNTRSP